MLSAPVQAHKPDKPFADAAPGENAVEFLAQSQQNGPTVTHYGYLTHIAGLEDEALFSDPAGRSEATARFTLLATTTLDARHEVGNIITTSAPGELNIYYNENPQGDFNDPASFGRGKVIAAFSMRYHYVLYVQAPNQGVASGTVDLVQLKMKEFNLNHDRLRFGRSGLRARLTAFGQGTRTNVDPVAATFLLGGNIVLTDA
jgi:hypothetical protein